MIPPVSTIPFQTIGVSSHQYLRIWRTPRGYRLTMDVSGTGDGIEVALADLAMFQTAVAGLSPEE